MEVSRTLLPAVAPLRIGLMVVSMILFGGLYGLVLISVAASKEHLPQSGLYVIAALSGLADLDAITLSTAIPRGAAS